MLEPDDLICRYTIQLRPRPALPTIGFVWVHRETGEPVASGKGFATQQGMRQAREIAFRTITQREPQWSPSQFPEAA